jgi:glycerophosphoryl diester phosphodiesterase
VIVSAHDGYPRHLNSGADFIEVDVRRTPGGEIVLAHDDLEPGHRYPTFEELLRALPNGVGLHLDLKEKGFELELMERAPTKVVVTPDFRESVETIKKHFPHVRVSPLDFVAIDQRYATEENLSRQTKPVWVWTVDDKKLMQRLMRNPGVEAIITNRPEVALKLRSARAGCLSGSRTRPGRASSGR